MQAVSHDYMCSKFSTYMQNPFLLYTADKWHRQEQIKVFRQTLSSSLLTGLYCHLRFFFTYLKTMLFSPWHLCKNNRTFVVQNSSVNVTEKETESVFLAFRILLLTYPGPMKCSAVNMVLQGQGQGQQQEQGQNRCLPAFGDQSRFLPTP